MEYMCLSMSVHVTSQHEQVYYTEKTSQNSLSQISRLFLGVCVWGVGVWLSVHVQLTALTSHDIHTVTYTGTKCTLELGVRVCYENGRTWQKI